MKYAILTLALAWVVFGHHSVAAEFDANKPVSLAGKVTKVDWLNPHIWVYLDVKGQDGKVVNWQCEGGAPNTLTRNGWTKNSLKIGDEIVIDGNLAKDASNTCKTGNVKLSSGKRVWAGSATEQ